MAPATRREPIPPPDVDPTEDRDMRAEPRAWVIDKHIPLALILTILAQTAGFGWWAGTISTRVTALEQGQPT